MCPVCSARSLERWSKVSTERDFWLDRAEASVGSTVPIFSTSGDSRIMNGSRDGDVISDAFVEQWPYLRAAAVPLRAISAMQWRLVPHQQRAGRARDSVDLTHSTKPWLSRPDPPKTRAKAQLQQRQTWRRPGKNW